MKRKIALALGLMIFGLSAYSKDRPQNAKEFLEKKTLMRESGGAGNGGNELVSEFFREGIFGLEALNFALKVTAEEKNKINLAMKSARVFPVEFQLCEDESDSSCSDEQAYVAKNYPLSNTILIDSRKTPHKWLQLSLKMKRRIAVHEFAGLAGIELSNHYFTSQIDDQRIFSDYKAKKDLKKYFSLINDLYFLLPSVPSYIYAGEWGKTTVIKPHKMEYTKSKMELLKGSKYHIQINLVNAQNRLESFVDEEGVLMLQTNWKEPAEPFQAWIDDKTDSDLYRDGDEVYYSDCSIGKIVDGEYICYSNYKGAPKWKGKFKKLFEPSFPVALNENATSFSCKALSEDDLICRHTYMRERSPHFMGWTYEYEYNFYKRLTHNRKFFNSSKMIPNSCQAILKNQIENVDEQASKIITLSMIAGTLLGPVGIIGGGLATTSAWFIFSEPMDKAYDIMDEAYVCNGKSLNKFYTQFSKSDEPKPYLSKEDFCATIVKGNEDGSLCTNYKRLTKKKLMRASHEVMSQAHTGLAQP